MKTFGMAIKERRKLLKLNQAALAALLPDGWSQPKVSALETGHRTPTIWDLRDLSIALEMPHEWLATLAIGSLVDPESP